MDEDEDPDVTYLAQLAPRLEAEAARIGLHAVAAEVASPGGPDGPDGPPVLLVRFVAGELAWSERVQGDPMGDLGDLKDDLSDIELEIAIREAEERKNERRQDPTAPE